MAQKDRSSPSGPLDLLGMCGEPIVVGKVPMATGHGDWQTVWTDGAGSLMGGQSLVWPTGGRKEACGVRSVPEKHRVGDASGSASKVTASVVSDYCEMYYP